MNTLPIGNIAFGPVDVERLKRLQRREYIAYSLIRQALQDWDSESFDFNVWDEAARVYMDRVEKDE